MSAKSIHTFWMVLIAAVLGLLGCSREGPKSGPDLLAPSPQAGLGSSTGANEVRIALPFDPSNFDKPVGNPYFPLTPGTVWSYRAETPDGVETNEVEVTLHTKVVAGVKTTVVRDRVFLEGSLKEDTFDWYAEDNDGNAWYFGEDTKELENGEVVSTAGSWEAGKGGAKAGIIMLARPKVGDTYKQEDAPGVVEDMGKVLSLKEAVSVPYGPFEPCLETAEWTPLEPGNRALKYYAAGIGLVLEVAPSGGQQRLELIGVSSR